MVFSNLSVSIPGSESTNLSTDDMMQCLEQGIKRTLQDV